MTVWFWLRSNDVERQERRPMFREREQYLTRWKNNFSWLLPQVSYQSSIFISITTRTFFLQAMTAIGKFACFTIVPSFIALIKGTGKKLMRGREVFILRTSDSLDVNGWTRYATNVSAAMLISFVFLLFVLVLSVARILLVFALMMRIRNWSGVVNNLGGLLELQCFASRGID